MRVRRFSTDFGIALALTEAGGDRLTGTGTLARHREYMSPEQAAGDRDLDARSDIYALGAVTYEMLAGEPPVTGPISAGDDREADDRARRRRCACCATSSRLRVDAAVMRALAKAPTRPLLERARVRRCARDRAAGASAAGTARIRRPMESAGVPSGCVLIARRGIARLAAWGTRTRRARQASARSRSCRSTTIPAIPRRSTSPRE